MTPLSPAPSTPRPCGHKGYSKTQINVRRMPEASPDNHTIRFISLVGGDRTLTAEQCRCYHLTYTLRQRGKSAEILGDDTEVVTAALTAVVAQTDVDVFTLTVAASKERSLVIPRHHLPVFTVER